MCIKCVYKFSKLEKNVCTYFSKLVRLKVCNDGVEIYIFLSC